MTVERRVDAVIVRDAAGTYYEIPWEPIAGFRVSDGRARELQAMVEQDTGGFLANAATVRPSATQTIALPTTNIIAILIG